MTGSAAYLRKLAERYHSLAATMRSEHDRQSVENVAVQYQQLADDAEQQEKDRPAYGRPPKGVVSLR